MLATFGGLIWSLINKENVHFDLLILLHLNSNLETRNDNFVEIVVANWTWDFFWFDPVMKFVRGASSAHKRPHTLCMGQLCFTWANFLRVPMHNTLFWSTASIRVLGNWLASLRNCHTSLRHMAFWEASWGLPWQETQDIPTPPKSTFDGIKHALLAIRVEFFSPYRK